MARGDGQCVCCSAATPFALLSFFPSHTALQHALVFLDTANGKIPWNPQRGGHDADKIITKSAPLVCQSKPEGATRPSPLTRSSQLAASVRHRS